MQHSFVRKGIHTGFWWERLKEGGHWEDLDVGRRIMLNASYRNRMRWHGMD
jgi:hypothetical protein